MLRHNEDRNISFGRSPASSASSPRSPHHGPVNFVWQCVSLQLSFMGLRLRVDRRAFRAGASCCRSQPCWSPRRLELLKNQAFSLEGLCICRRSANLSDLIAGRGGIGGVEVVDWPLERASSCLGCLWAQSLASVALLRSLSRRLGRVLACCTTAICICSSRLDRLDTRDGSLVLVMHMYTRPYLPTASSTTYLH